MAQKRGDEYKFTLIEYARNILRDEQINCSYLIKDYPDAVLNLAEKIHNWIQEDFSPAKSKGDDETK